MTFDQFYDRGRKYLIDNLTYLRKGQAFQTVLSAVRPDLDKKTTENGLNVFSNDAKFPEFVAFLRQNW